MGVWPHIRTTAFWADRDLFNSYPVSVTRNDQRYPFEHGKDCITSWATANGVKALVVEWDYVTEWAEWDNSPNGYHRGDQSGLLALDHICEPPIYPG